MKCEMGTEAGIVADIGCFTASVSFILYIF